MDYYKKVAICGPPNAGKSSFLNLLANREAAIVSPIAGTTRDVIEVTLDLGGVRCIVSDTAGVREDSSTGDIIEIEGMKRARKAALDAHVLVCMVDANEKQSGFTAIKEVFDDTLETNVFLLYNKIDLLGTQTNQSETSEQIDNILLGKAKSFEISCENNDGVDEFIDVLTQKVISRVSSESIDDDEVIEEDSTVITRARHRQHVTGASEALHRFQMRSSEGYMSLDLAAEELRLAASELGRITGAVDVEDVLDVLFSDFCIGK
jgi:tRNA modification GTPase